MIPRELGLSGPITKIGRQEVCYCEPVGLGDSMTAVLIQRATDVLKLVGLDAVNGTPVLDLKPWVAEFAPRGPTFQPAWITELMRGYW